MLPVCIGVEITTACAQKKNEARLQLAGARELTAAACAFGNTLTLPLVFLAALLPAAAYERAVGYTALFLMGWSPLLWSVGYQLLGSAGDLADETSAALGSC